MFSINLRILQVIFTYLINLNNSNFYPSLYKYWVIKFGSPNFDRKISVKLNPMHQNIRKIIIIIIIFHLYKIYKRNDEKIIILQVTILHKIQLYPLERGLKTKRNYPRQSVHGSTSSHLQLFQEFVCIDEVRYIYRASFICKRTELCSAGMLTSTFQDDVASKEIFALDTAGPL